MKGLTVIAVSTLFLTQLIASPLLADNSCQAEKRAVRTATKELRKASKALDRNQRFLDKFLNRIDYSQTKMEEKVLDLEAAQLAKDESYGAKIDGYEVEVTTALTELAALQTQLVIECGSLGGIIGGTIGSVIGLGGGQSSAYQDYQCRKMEKAAAKAESRAKKYQVKKEKAIDDRAASNAKYNAKIASEESRYEKKIQRDQNRVDLILPKVEAAQTTYDNKELKLLAAEEAFQECLQQNEL